MAKERKKPNVEVEVINPSHNRYQAIRSMDAASKALDKIKDYRKGRKYKMVQVDNKTWKEIEIK